MKRFICLFGIILNLSAECYPQTGDDPKVLIGVSQGISFSQMDFQVTMHQSLHPGYNGGFFITYFSESKVGIQLEFNYAQKGWKITPDSSEYYSRKLNYLEIPFMTHIAFGKHKSRLIIDLGPYASFLNSESESTNIPGSTIEYVEYKVNRKFEFGYCLGVGYQHSTAIGNFGIDARYYNSLTNIFTPSSEIHYFASRNQVLCFSLKYCIKIF